MQSSASGEEQPLAPRRAGGWKSSSTEKDLGQAAHHGSATHPWQQSKPTAARSALGRALPVGHCRQRRPEGPQSLPGEILKTRWETVLSNLLQLTVWWADPGGHPVHNATPPPPPQLHRAEKMSRKAERGTVKDTYQRKYGQYNSSETGSKSGPHCLQICSPPRPLTFQSSIVFEVWKILFADGARCFNNTKTTAYPIERKETGH